MSDSKTQAIESHSLPQDRISWVEYWDRWIIAASLAGDLSGLRTFLLKSVAAMNGRFEGDAPADSSMSMSFEDPTTLETKFYTWEK